MKKYNKEKAWRSFYDHLVGEDLEITAVFPPDDYVKCNPGKRGECYEVVEDGKSYGICFFDADQVLWIGCDEPISYPTSEDMTKVFDEVRKRK